MILRKESCELPGMNNHSPAYLTLLHRKTYGGLPSSELRIGYLQRIKLAAVGSRLCPSLAKLNYRVFRMEAGRARRQG